MFKKNKIEEIPLESIQNLQLDKILLGIILILILLFVLFFLVVFTLYSVKKCKCDQTLLKIGKENQEFIQVLNNHHKMNKKNVDNERQIQNSKIITLIKKLNDI